MTGASEPQFLDVGTGPDRRRIAVRARPGKGPALVWLGGFRSDMASTKAMALDAWGERNGRAVVRFDYSGHGESGGRFEDGTIGRWLAESLEVIAAFAQEPTHQPPLLVGSSMGGWIALLAARELARRSPPLPLAGLVLVAPAADFTQRLMWEAFPAGIRRQIEEEGVWMRPSAYSPEPYPITRALIEDGRNHLLMDAPFSVGCPVRILQGMQDPDVPWRHALALVELMPHDPVAITLVNDGDHRLSRDEDIARLIAAVEGL
jgi:pimeloyl-ACP methyl ester carboxylesterase